jgi:hypothetical protein
MVYPFIHSQPNSSLMLCFSRRAGGLSKDTPAPFPPSPHVGIRHCHTRWQYYARPPPFCFRENSGRPSERGSHRPGLLDILRYSEPSSPASYAPPAFRMAVTIAQLFKQIASRRKLLFKRMFSLNMFNTSGAWDRGQMGKFKHCLNGQKANYSPRFEPTTSCR